MLFTPEGSWASEQNWSFNPAPLYLCPSLGNAWKADGPVARLLLEACTSEILQLENKFQAKLGLSTLSNSKWMHILWRRCHSGNSSPLPNSCRECSLSAVYTKPEAKVNSKPTTSVHSHQRKPRQCLTPTEPPAGPLWWTLDDVIICYICSKLSALTCYLLANHQ